MVKKVNGKYVLKVSNKEDFGKQVPRNLITNIIFFLINIVIGIFLVPFFIDTLGVAGYGLIPLATSVTNYVGLVTQSLNMSVSRFLTVDLKRKDFKKANIIFNTAFFGTFGIILLLIPMVFVISYYAPDFFKVPSNQTYEVILLFLGVMGAFLIKTLSSVFGVSLFAYNRLDIQNIIELFNIVIQVFLIILLFSVFSPRLSFIGLSYLIGAIFAFIMTFYFSRKVNPHFNINYLDFKLSQLKEIAGMSKWLILNQIGALLFLQIDLIVVNKLFGAAAGGEYASVLIWSILLRSMAGVLSGVLTPVILTYYATNRFEEIINISKSSVKFMGFAMALPIGFISAFAPQILSIWLGPGFMKLAPLMWIFLSHLIINLSVLPLFSINTAFNKVRIPGILTLIMGFGNLSLALIIPYITGWGYYGVAVAGAIVLTFKNSLFIPWYATKVLSIPKHTFIGSMLPGVISTVMIAGVITGINRNINISTIIPMIITGIVMTMIYLSIIWLVGLNSSERKIIKSFIPFQQGD